MRLRSVLYSTILAITVVAASACSAAPDPRDQVKENGDDLVSIIWTPDGSGTCQVRGNDRSQQFGLHLMPSDQAPRTYQPDVCRGGTPVSYTLHFSGDLQIKYRVSYTITRTVYPSSTSCYLELKPRDTGWEHTVVEPGKLIGCRRYPEGGKYTLEHTAPGDK